MNYKNCVRCGRLFSPLGGRSICDNCRNAEEEGFQRIRAYINENPACTMAELAEATDVRQKRILQYIREGRLQVSEGMHGEVRCESCNAPIDKGRHCEDCKKRVNQEIHGAFGKMPGPPQQQPEVKKSAKMHTAVRKKD